MIECVRNNKIYKHFTPMNVLHLFLPLLVHFLWFGLSFHPLGFGMNIISLKKFSWQSYLN